VIVAGGHSQRRDLGNFTNIYTRLLVSENGRANDFVCGILREMANSDLAERTCTPLNNAQSIHLNSPGDRAGIFRPQP
jgi:hypothetical protein